MAIQAGKAKRVEGAAASAASVALGKSTSPARPSVARAEIVDKATRARFEEELDGALKRKPANEVKLAGALRAVATISPALRTAMADAAQIMVRRSSFTREIYGACMRTLAEADDRRVGALLKAALAAEDAGGITTLSAATFCKDPILAAPLAKLAASQRAHIAFGAETARVCRGESNGAHLASVAPMIKESHRIALCVEVFVPLVRSAPVPVLIGPALNVLRGAERHLGRWLVLAEIATKAGDPEPLAEASAKAAVGPTSARAAWALVSWALQDTKAKVSAAGLPASSALALPPAPSTRPTVELVARLSDRPSADRDTTFLFRMARARAVSCKPMLEGLAKGIPLTDEVSIRAASFLARDHGREDMKDALLDCARNATRDELQGLAVAALWDTGDADARRIARELSDELVVSRCLSNVAWGALIRAASATQAPPAPGAVVVGETPFRWVQWGWLE